MSIEYGPLKRSSTRWTWGWITISIALLGSLSTNISFVYRQMVRPWELVNELATQFASLRRNVPTEILSSSDFGSLNRTVQDAAWGYVKLEPWNGFVALDEGCTIAQGLLHSQRWPWDPSKGVYIMTSSHELHCVRKYHYPHLMHCLNVLRQSTMCNADDTPLYIGRLHKNVHETSTRAGTGTVKMCCDWHSLLAWSRAHSACYRPVHLDKTGFREIDRYKSCLDHSRPWERVDRPKV
ncbi:hypothetical protein HD806DRAFT_526352 [Xylariaceae sp. AK1471]|nr:hypothetical protein HD806DRAFT_526352 [Xylariaceae sp. AK1471]